MSILVNYQIFKISRDVLFYDWSLMTWVYGIAQGVLAFCGVVLLLMALQLISPTQNKVIRSFQVVGSYILQVSAGVNLASIFSQSTMDLYGVLRSNLHTF